MKTSFVALVSLASVGFGSLASAQTIPPSGLNFSGPVTVGAPQVNAPVAAPQVNVPTTVVAPVNVQLGQGAVAPPQVNVDAPQVSVDKPVSISAPVTVKPDIPVGAVQVKDNNLSLVNAPNLGDAAQLQTKSVAFPGFSSSLPVAELRGGLYPSCAAAPISSSQIWGMCSVTGKFEIAVPLGTGLSKTEKRARAAALFQQELQSAKLLAEADGSMKEKSMQLIQEALVRYETALAKYR
jgi:hypothetical protein